MSIISKHFSIGLICLATTLALYSIWSAPVFYLDSTDWGIVNKLPISFWMGIPVLGLYCFYIFSKKTLKNSDALLVPVLVLLFFQFVPQIMERPIGLSLFSLWPSSEGNLLVSNGHISFPSTRPLMSYESWPLFTIFDSILMMLAGIPLASLAEYFPLFNSCLLGLLAFSILRQFLKSSYASLGTAWFLCCQILAGRFVPQSIAFVMFLMYVLLFVKVFFGKNEKIRIRLLLLGFITFFALVFTHALTSLMIILILFVFYLMTAMYERSRKSIRLNRRSSVTMTMCIVCLVIFFFHAVFFAPNFFSFATRETYNSALNFLELPFFQEMKRLPGSSFQQLTNLSIYALVLVNVAISGIAILQILRKRTMDKQQLLFWISFIIALGFPALLLREYGQEGILRAVVFGSVCFSWLSIYLLKSKPRIFVISLIVLSILFIPALYGTESYRLSTATELSGAKYVAIYLPKRTSCLYRMPSYVRYYNPLVEIEFTYFGKTPFSSEINSSTVNKQIMETDYVVFSRNQDNYYIYYLGENPFAEMDYRIVNRFSQLYQNGYFCIVKNPRAHS